MSAKKIHVITMPAQDYDSIIRMTDKEVVAHLNYVCKLSKKRIVPASARRNQCRVTRGTNRVTVHLLFNGKETCRVSFVPWPVFIKPV